MDISIREMTAGDLPTIVSMEVEIFPDPWPLTSFEEALAEPGWNALVAENGETIVGYALYLVVGSESHLANIAVDENCRRKSVAKRLLEHILQCVTRLECEYILLEVRPSNLGAIAFYRKYCFQELYRRPNYYRHPAEDALVMVFYLSDDKEEN